MLASVRNGRRTTQSDSSCRSYDSHALQTLTCRGSFKKAAPKGGFSDWFYLIDNLDDNVSARVNQHRVSVDNRISVLARTRIFRRHVIICYTAFWEHCTDAKFIAIFVRRVMTFNNITVEPRTIIDTQYAVDAAYHAANNRSHGPRVVLANASAMSRAVGHALSVCACRHCERDEANEYDTSNHVSL